MTMTAAPAVEQLLDRRQGGADAAVVGDGAGLLVERHVEIDADQDALAVQVAAGRRGSSWPWSISNRLAAIGASDIAQALRADARRNAAARLLMPLPIMYRSRSTQRLRVAPLVVVPADELEEPAVQLDAACRRRRCSSAASWMKSLETTSSSV